MRLNDKIRRAIILKTGLTLPQAGEQATKENIDTAKKAEREGFDSLWVFERLLYPMKPKNPYLGTPDGSLPIQYQRVLEPLETLSFVSANTERITLGTSVIDILFHTPVILVETCDVRCPFRRKSYSWFGDRLVEG